MDVQERLRELMTQRNWSAYRLAKQAGLSETTISNLFKRGQLPTIYTLERICDAFDITLCQFFAEATRPPTALRRAASSSAASLWRSASGSTATCTGASHKGSAPA